MSDKFNNKFSPAKANKTKVSTSGSEWVKNAVKSLGYSSMDILNDVMPSTIDAVKSVTELSQEVAENIKDFKGHTEKLKSTLDKNVYMELGRNLKNYTLEDLKTGKFYNKERADSFDDEDFDLDFDIGDPSDFDASLSSSSSDESTDVTISNSSKDGKDVDVVQVSTNINSDNPMVSAVQEQTRVSYEGSNLVAEVSKRNHMMAMSQMNAATSQIGTHLGSMSDNISIIVEILGDTLSKHVGLSSQYYNDSMGAFNNILSELKIVSQQAKLSTANTTDMSSYKDYKNVLDTVFTSGGFVDIKEYIGLIKNQFNKVSDNNFILSSMKNMASQTDVLAEMVKNPLRFVSDSIVKKFIPNMVQKAAEKFDETFRETAIAGLYQIRNMGNSTNMIKEIIGKTFGIGNAMKSSVDKSNYNKGPVPFDGITHRTINDVIPFYLRRTVALLEGSQEVAFNYEKGVFDTVKNITDNADRERNRRKLGGLTSVAGDFGDYLSSNFKFTDPAQAAELNKSFNTLLTSMVDRDGGINFRRFKDRNGIVRDDIAEILDIRDENSSVLNIIRGFFEGSENSYNLRTFGREALEARAGYDRYMRDVEANPILYNNNLLDTGVKTDTHIEYKKNSNDFTKKAGGILGADVYDKDALYYLRQTADMIAKGIGVFILGGSIPERGRNRIKNTPPVVNPNASMVTEFSNQKSDYDSKNGDKASKALSQEKIDSIKTKGEYTVVDTKDTDSTLSINSKQAAELRRSQIAKEEEPDEEKPSFLSKLASIRPESAFSKIITKFDTMNKNSATKLEGYFNKANDTLFKLVFGSDETKEGKGGSFIQRAFEGLKLQFSVFGNWMDKTLLTPIYEHLFGDNGLFTQLKNTQFAQDIKNAFKNMGDKLFGIDDGQGNKVGGLLSAVVNEFKDAGRYTMQFLTGKEYIDSKGQKHSATDQSVFGVFKNVASSMSDSFHKFVGVEKFDASKSKTGSRLLDGVDSIWTTVKTKTNDFIDDVLGTPDKSQTRREFSKFTSEMSEGMPKIAASSIAGLGIGLIPSLFIPGGPIGGAIIGAGMGIVSQSSKIKEFLFGPEVNGERIGGLVNKEIQDFFKDNKMGIGLGLGAGTLASLGLIPSLFVPGGPIGGALIGGAISMANKSESLHKFLFGEDLDGNKIEGSISDKFESMTGITLKEGFVGAGIGAGVGLIGSFFLPGGPIVGSLLGSAAGLALSSDKFKTYLFGDKDPTTGRRHGGMFGAVGDWTKEHLFNPMGKAIKEAQINVMGFIKKEMVAPLAVSLIPIKEEFKRFKDRVFGGINKFFNDFGDRVNTSFDKYFGQPIGEFLETKVLNPLKGVISKLFGGIGKIFGSVISSPFKLLNAVADGLYSKHQKEGVADLKERTVNTVFKSKDEQGNKITFGQKFNAAKEYISPKGREAARYSDKGAWYRDDYEGRIAQYRAKVDADMNRKKMDLDHAYQTGNINDKAYKAQIKKIETENKVAKAKVPNGNNADTQTKTTVATESPKQPQQTRPVEPTTDTKAVVADSDRATKSKVVANYTTDGTKPVKVSKGTKATVSKQPKPITNQFDKPAKAVKSDIDDGAMSSAKAANDKSRGISKAKRDSLLVRMDKNLQVIADATKGQLDGVGKNVYRITKMLQKNLGISDDDITGSANKDRQGFLGKLKGMIKNPLRGMKEMMMTPFRVMGSVANYFKDSIVDTITGVTSVIKMSVGGLFKFAKGLGKAALDLLSIPKTILQMGLEGLKMIGPAVAETLKSGVQIVGKSIMTGIDLIGTGVKALGSTIVEGAKGLGMLIGGAMQGLGHLMVGAGVIAKDAAVAITKGVLKATAFVGNAAFKGITGITGWTFDKLFRRDSKHDKRSNRVQRVVVEGGFLDKINSIGNDSPIKEKVVGSTPVENDIEKNSKIGTTDVSEEYGENTDGVVTGLRLHAKEQEAKIADEAERKAIAESRAAVVSGGSHETRTAEWAAAEQAENEMSYKERLLHGIISIKNTAMEQASNWTSIFGKKGLITGAILLGIPLVVSLIEKIKDLFGDDDDDDDGDPIPSTLGEVINTINEKDEAGRVDAEGQEYKSLQLEGRGLKLGLVGGVKVIDFFTGKGGKISKALYDRFASNPKVAKEFFTQSGKKILDENGEEIATKLTERGAQSAVKRLNKQMTVESLQSYIKEGGSKLLDGATNLVNTHYRNTPLEMAVANGKAMLKDVTSKATMTATDNKTLVGKFTQGLQKAFNHILESGFVQKYLTGEALSSIKGTIAKLVSNIGDYAIKSGAKFLGKIGVAVAKDGSLVFPPLGVIVKVLFGTMDFISGMTTEAGKIFQVRKEDVSMGMRIAAGISKLIVGLSACIDLGNEIYRIMTDGQGLREFFAELIYTTGLKVEGFIVGKDATESVANFQQKQENFKTEFEAYNDTLRAQGKDEMSFIGYMDREHEGMMSKISRGVGNAWESTKTMASNAWEGTKTMASNAWEGTKNVASNIWDGAKTGVSNAVTGTKNFLNNAWEGTKTGVSNAVTGTKNFFNNAWEGTKNVASNIWDGAKTGVSNAVTGTKNFLNNAWEGTKNIVNKGVDYVGGIWDSGVDFTKSVGNFFKVLLSPLTDFVGEKITEVKEVINVLWGSVTTKVGEIKDKAVDMASIFWEDIKLVGTEVKNVVMGGVNKVKEVVGNVWDTMSTKVGEIKDKVVDMASIFWEDIKLVGTEVKNVVVGGVTLIKDKVVDLWDAGVTKVVEIKDTMVERMIAFKDGAVAVWETVTTKVNEFIEPAVEWFDDKFTMVKDKIGDIWKGITDGAEDIVDSITGGIKGVISKVTGFFGNIWGNVTGFFGDTWDNVKGWFGEKTNSSEYMTNVVNAGKDVFRSGRDLATSIYNPNAADRGGEFSKGEATPDDKHQGFAYYSQGDPRWGKKSYLPGGKDRSMAYGGCGPTSLAMVISQLTGEPVDPYSVAKESSKRGMVSADGTEWNAMTELPAMAGLTSQFIGTGDTSYRFNDSSHSEQVMEALKQNKPVILSGNRSSSSSKEESPFTTGGHFVVAHATDGDSVVINDPRSKEASKLYDFDDVMKETKGAWKFPTNVRAEYSTFGSTSSYTDDSESKPGGIMGAITGTMDAFLKPLKEFLYGKDNQQEELNYSNYQFGDMPSSSSYNSMASNVQESIANKTAQLMRSNESSNNYAIAKNDTTGDGTKISPSIGILQWRQDNAKALMERMYKQLPNDPDARYFAKEVNWDDRTPWSEQQLTRYRNFMTRNASISKQVQDKFSVEHIQKTILPNVYKHAVDTGKIKDPRSIVMLADISQTGPGHVPGFMTGKWADGSKYSHGKRPYNTRVPAGMTEFDHFNNEIRSSSTNYWGKHLNTYKGRFDKSYNALKSWMPHDDIKQGPVAMDKGGEVVNNYSITKAPEVVTMDKGGETTCNYSMDKGGYDNYVAENTVREVIKYKEVDKASTGKDSSVLREVVNVLKDILVESRGTNRGIDAFNRKKFPEASNQQIIMDNSVHTSNTNNQNKYGSVQSGKPQTQKAQQKSLLNTPQYRMAKDIALGINT